MPDKLFPLGKYQFDELEEKLTLEGVIRENSGTVYVDTRKQEWYGAKMTEEGGIELSNALGFVQRSPAEIKEVQDALEYEPSILERLKRYLVVDVIKETVIPAAIVIGAGVAIIATSVAARQAFKKLYDFVVN